MVCKHISTDYSSTDIVTRSAESGIFCCYSQVEEPSNYFAGIYT